MKKQYSLLLIEAYSSFRKKKYSETILILEKVISTDRSSSPYPYFLLSLSYLLTNQFSKADSMIKRIKMIDPEYLPCHHLESFIFLKSAASQELALSKYIDALDKYPDDKYLQKALNTIKKVKNFNTFQKSARLTDFIHLPKPEKNLPFRIIKSDGTRGFNNIIIYITGSVTLIVIIIITISLALRQETKYTHESTKHTSKTQIDFIQLDGSRYDLIDKIRKKKSPVFYYSNEEVLRDFNRAKKLIKRDDYNRALILLNKINNSNSNFKVKERVGFLRKFILNVEDRKYDIISFGKISRTPYMYKGLFIKWKGRVANLKEKENRLIFNLMVDYKRNDIFSGIIDVYSEKYPEDIKNGDLVEIEAVFVNTLGGDNRMYFVAKKIQKVI